MTFLRLALNENDADVGSGMKLAGDLHSTARAFGPCVFEGFRKCRFFYGFVRLIQRG